MSPPGIEEKLTQATRQAIDAVARIDRAKWPKWADNVPVFTLCRHLAAVVDPCAVVADVLEPYVLAFWSAVHDPAEWDEAWEQFCDIWDHSKAKIPPAADIVQVAIDRARHASDRPEWATKGTPRMRHLARICWELGAMSPDGVFYLSQKQAAGILAIDQRTAGRLFHMLARECVIVETDRPPKGTLKAVRYRFCVSLSKLPKRL